jgi:hypothetical protein
MTIEIQYELHCEPEDLNYRDEMDEDNADWIEEQIDHNPWAWFCAKVVASVEIDGERFEGVDYLGGCSYESRADFEIDEPGHYYHDMKAAAKDALKSALYAAHNRGEISRRVLSEIK